MRKQIFIIIVIVFSCNNNKTNTDYIKVKTGDVKLEKALIIGKTDDLRDFEYFNITNNSSFSFKLKNYINEFKVIGDSLVLEIDSIAEPQLILMSSYTDNLRSFAKFILKPKDTIIFEIKNKRLLLIGEKANEYNFYSNLKDSTPNYQYKNS